MPARTEAPTRRRLRRARSEGDVPVSVALMQSAGLLAALALAPAAVTATSARTSDLLRQALQLAPLPWSAWQLAGDVVLLTLPLAAAAAVASVAVGVMQTGGVVSFRAFVPDSSRANPFTGLARLLSGRCLANLAQALVAAAVVGGLVASQLLKHATDLAACAGRAAHAQHLEPARTTPDTGSKRLISWQGPCRNTFARALWEAAQTMAKAWRSRWPKRPPLGRGFAFS